MGNISGKPTTMKEINIGLIKKALKKIGAATRAELTESTGISQTTVRSLLEELLGSNEVIRLGLDKSSGGRRAERYALNLNESLVLSCYIRDRHIDYVISNTSREIIKDEYIEIESNNYLFEIEKIIENSIKDGMAIKAIGIAVPGVVDIDKRKYFYGKKLSGWEESNIGEYIEDKYNIPVVLENDLNTIAYGYGVQLIDKLHVDDLDILNMIYIHFTNAGVGSGIIVNGELVHGGNNFAGELGFMPIGNEGQYLQSIIESNPEEIKYVDAVSRLIATVNCVINPDIVVIGGEDFRNDLINSIIDNSKNYSANNIVPEIFLAENSRRDCIVGIVELTIKLMYSGIRLIDNGRKNR
ncbi:hypothetical protein CSC2_34780 [Clostridium zeae]|uniref:ROK family protein n=1 Tax=Clostridium zeae TaxID=2759022 RepID=A0ABQ1EDU1_9CLOT|nr:ROK family protein [Clostridium zeae]GFZ32952.1 hypothetical protein CSC2_34780 [Clostridium zeae]